MAASYVVMSVMSMTFRVVPVSSDVRSDVRTDVRTDPLRVRKVSSGQLWENWAFVWGRFGAFVYMLSPALLSYLYTN